MPDLPEIPIVDARNGGTLQHARDSRDRGLAMRQLLLDWFPSWAAPLAPLVDRFARRLLIRSRTPYLAELGEVAAVLGFPGIWFLNGSYLWSCTAVAREEGVPWLARTLDWPFPGLGLYADVVRMQGPAGEYLNVSWPGYVGVLTACAPGRFAAAINQAPMRRRSHARALRLFDVAINAFGTIGGMRHLPPDQLLRQVFDRCRNYQDAKHMLETAPIARPVIFTLAGSQPGECCVIERTQQDATTRDGSAGAANDWLEPQPGWEARIGLQRVFTSTFQEAADYSFARRTSLAGWSGSFMQSSFGWMTPPVLNPYTRLGIEMCAARGIVRVIGYERAPGEDLARPVTRPREVTVQRASA